MHTGLADALFSGTQQRVMGWLFGQPQRSFYAAELCGIVQKTVGLAEPLRAALAPLAKKIRAAFIYGSVARREDTAKSDIDLMLIGDKLTYADVFEALETAGARLGRTVNPTIYTRKELARRRTEDNAFVTRVLAQPKLWLIGGEDDLAA